MNYKDTEKQSEINSNNEIEEQKAHLDRIVESVEVNELTFRNIFKDHLDHFVSYFETGDEPNMVLSVNSMRELFNANQMKYLNIIHDIFDETNFPDWLIHNFHATLNQIDVANPNVLPLMPLVTICNMVVASSQNEDFLTYLLEMDYVEGLESLFKIQNLNGKSYILVCYVNIFNASPTGRVRYQKTFALSYIFESISDILAKRSDSDNDDDFKFILYYINYYMSNYNMTDNEIINVIQLMGEMITCENSDFISNMLDIIIQILADYKQKKLEPKTEAESKATKEAIKKMKEAFIETNIPEYAFHYFLYHTQINVIERSVTALTLLDDYDFLSEGEKRIRDQVFNECIDRISQSIEDVDENIITIDGVVDPDKQTVYLSYANYICQFIDKLKDAVVIRDFQDNDIVGTLMNLLPLSDMKIKIVISNAIFTFINKIPNDQIPLYFNEEFFAFLEDAINYESPELISNILICCNKLFSFAEYDGRDPIEMLDLFPDSEEFHSFVNDSIDSPNENVAANAILLNSIFVEASS